jgi:hypothetical protein
MMHHPPLIFLLEQIKLARITMEVFALEPQTVMIIAHGLENFV